MMKKLQIWSTALLFAVTSTGAFAQQITGSSLFSPSAGGARILSAQGNTAASPAIGFQSNVSSTGTPEEDGGGGNGIFRPLANTMAFATGSVERMRIGSGGNIGIGTTNPFGAALHILTGSNPGMLQPLIKLDRNDGTNQAGLLSVGISGNGFGSGLLGGGSAYFKLEDPYGNSPNSDMGFSTNGAAAQFVIKHNGFVGVGTETPMSQLEVTTTNITAPAIKANGKSVGIYAEATAQESNLIKRSNIYGDLDGIAVFGNAKYTTNTTNGSMYGVVGSATETSINNVGVFGEAKNASGYNHGVVGYVNSPTGIYNSAVAGHVELNTTAVYNRAIWGYAPVAANHFAGYFDGNVDIKSGVVTIGNGTLCTPTGYKLFVEEGILTEKVKVAVNCSTAWADYVFANDYKLKPLSEVEAYVKENKHLPNIPSASELVNDGLNLGEMQAKQMEKIEELTLYMIEMKKEIDTLKKENQSLKVLVAQPKN